MACYGMRRSLNAVGLDDSNDQAWLDRDGGDWFDRFCLGPSRPDLLKPLHERPLAANPDLDDIEEAMLMEYAFAK